MIAPAKAKPGPEDARSYVLARISGHIAGLLTTGLGVGVLAFVLYGGIVFDNAKTGADLGGPLNFVLVPALAGILAGVVALVVFLPLTLVAEWMGVIRCLLGASVLSLISITGALFVFLSQEARHFLTTENSTLGAAAIIWFAFIVGFTFYLSVFAVLRRVVLSLH